MKNSLLIASDGLRLAFTSTKNRLLKPKKYSGNTEEICRAIIKDCFDKRNKYFRVSPNNFRQFYARDFGMCCESLIKLGYKSEVRQTLVYAMDIYQKKRKITTQITPFGSPVNFPSYTPESAAYMLNSLIILNDRQLIIKYKKFFREIAEHIYNHDIDKKTGLLRMDKHFSSIKDYSLRKSDCYNNCFLALFAENMKKINTSSPISAYNYREIIKKHFLRKDYFLEDLSGKDIFAGDANIFPFWTGLFKPKNPNDRKILKKIIKKIKDKKLDFPWPLKYTAKEDAPKKMHLADIFNPGYEKDTLWMHLGLCYIKTIKSTDKKLLRKYLAVYERLIKKNKTCHEVFNSEGKIFSRPLYRSDEGMLWCSIFLELYLGEKNK